MNLLNFIKKVGGQRKLAEIMTSQGYPISQVAISHWIKRGNVSKAFAVHIETVFGIPKEQIRPDIFSKNVKTQKYKRLLES